MIDGRPRERYDPWRELRERWPEVDVVIAPLRGDLLGTLRYPLITLRAGTSAAQRRCTLTHELVHLERGGLDCGPCGAREERLVHAEAARRLIPLDLLVEALRTGAARDDPGRLADLLDVDAETLRVRLDASFADIRTHSRDRSIDDLWSVA